MATVAVQNFSRYVIKEEQIASISLTNGKQLQYINSNTRHPVFDLDNILECIGLIKSNHPTFLKLKKEELEQYFDNRFSASYAIEYEERLFSLCKCSWQLLREISAHIALQPHDWTDVCEMLNNH